MSGFSLFWGYFSCFIWGNAREKTERANKRIRTIAEFLRVNAWGPQLMGTVRKGALGWQKMTCGTGSKYYGHANKVILQQRGSSIYMINIESGCA